MEASNDEQRLRLALEKFIAKISELNQRDIEAAAQTSSEAQTIYHYTICEVHWLSLRAVISGSQSAPT
jgi:hypothetical protein